MAIGPLRWRVAKRDETCNECNRAIYLGERFAALYESCRIVIAGRWRVYKSYCNDCGEELEQEL